MIFFPAIDLKDGKCVRLFKGDMNQATIFNNNPSSQALEFEKLGINIVLNEQDDTMHIYGNNIIYGGKVSSHNDHRIAMCLAIAGMFSETEIEIDQAESVGKSYLDFWGDFTSIRSLL
jgi:5-enolpyruvylshikimate-3-phosphate synthase